MLKSQNLLDSTKKGHFLSKQGYLEWNKISDNLQGPKAINTKLFYPECQKSALLLRKSEELKEIYKLRDIAVKNGAEGALILKFQNKLYAPESDYKGDFAELEQYFEFKNRNVLIIAFAQDFKNAEIG